MMKFRVFGSGSSLVDVGIAEGSGGDDLAGGGGQMTFSISEGDHADFCIAFGQRVTAQMGSYQRSSAPV